MIDLHSHTHASDGQHSPTELISKAASAGVTQLAVTDHDTLAGLAEATAAARERGLQLIPGIEISAFVDQREVHVLGHFVRTDDTKLLAFCQGVQGERTTRMERMVERMNGLGYTVGMGDVAAIAQGAQLCRPHLARALVARGHVSTTKEAFDRFLGDGKPGHVDREKLAAEEAIALIRQAGGTATLAHPAVSKMGPLEIERLRNAGLAGLEVFHSDHNPNVRRKLLELARSLGLVPTAGSDFHGEKVAPGRVLGSASMDPADFEALRQKAASTTEPAARS
jgi:predicted metal-dependent phosphoesterase TrpH